MQRLPWGAWAPLTDCPLYGLPAAALRAGRRVQHCPRSVGAQVPGQGPTLKELPGLANRPRDAQYWKGPRDSTCVQTGLGHWD